MTKVANDDIYRTMYIDVCNFCSIYRIYTHNKPKIYAFYYLHREKLQILAFLPGLRSIMFFSCFLFCERIKWLGHKWHISEIDAMYRDKMTRLIKKQKIEHPWENEKLWLMMFYSIVFLWFSSKLRSSPTHMWHDVLRGPHWWGCANRLQDKSPLSKKNKKQRTW
jgi:hypothetical protein